MILLSICNPAMATLHMFFKNAHIYLLRGTYVLTYLFPPFFFILLPVSTAPTASILSWHKKCKGVFTIADKKLLSITTK